MQAFNSYLCSTVHVAHAHKGRGYRWATEEASFADMKRMVPKSVGACFALIETRHVEGAVGDGRAATRSAIPIFTLASWLEGDSVDLSTLPKVADRMKRMAERPAVREVLGRERAAA